MKKDQRVLKTEKNIQSSLMDLLTYKSLSKITITELAQKAGIERKTFYLHYDSIDDVLLEIEDQLQSELAHKLLNEKTLTAEKLLEVLDSLMLKERKFYQGIMITSPNTFLNDDFQLILERCLEKYIVKSVGLISPERKKYYSAFLSAGIMQCYRKFLEDSNSKIENVDAVLKDILKQYEIS